MLRRRSGLSRPVLTWAAQAAASLGATLAASVIGSALPHSTPGPQPALTSGGKYAERAVEAVAYDGLDVMPVPRLRAAPPAVAVLPATAAALRSNAPVQRAVSKSPPFASPAPERPVRTARSIAPRDGVGTPLRADASSRPAPAAETVLPVAEVREEAGLLSSVGSGLAATTRAAWGTTAAVSEALMARVVPQMP